jgi:hypothetical protein
MIRNEDGKNPKDFPALGGPVASIRSVGDLEDDAEAGFAA